MPIEPPTLVYLSYKFSNDPTFNTKVARLLALKIMEKHPEWYVLVPHFCVDAMLDGVVKWKEGFKFSEWRRGRAGLMAIAFLSRCDKVILGCEPTYEQSAGVTWEWNFVKLLNSSWRKDNPIEIIHLKDAIDLSEYPDLEGLVNEE
jgi:hypothetical protein